VPLTVKILEVDPCDPNPCLNGGTCMRSDDNSTFTCQCIQGFQGNTCQDIGNETKLNLGSEIFESIRYMLTYLSSKYFKTKVGPAKKFGITRGGGDEYL